MTFICKVEVRPDTIMFLQRNKENMACAKLLTSVLAEHFILSPQHESALLALREYCKGSESPFIDPFTKSRMILVRRAANRRCHFKRPNADPDRASGDTLIHQQVQVAIAGIGQRLKQVATLELPIDVPDGPQRYQRCDVVWMPAGIAWEVDLSHLPSPEQHRRYQVRKDAGYTMISVADPGNTSSDRLDYVPRVLLANMKKTAEEGKYLSTLRVTNAAPWNDSLQDWEHRLEIHPTFASLCRGILAGTWTYGNVSVHNSKFYQWAHRNDLAKCGTQTGDISRPSPQAPPHPASNVDSDLHIPKSIELRKLLRAELANHQQTLHALSAMHLAMERNDVNQWRVLQETWRSRQGISSPLVVRLLRRTLPWSPEFRAQAMDEVLAAMDEITMMIRLLEA